MIRTVSYDIEFGVRLNERMGDGHRVFISGSVPSLGSWVIGRALELDCSPCDEEKDGGDETKWYKLIHVADVSSREIRYRYFIGEWLARGDEGQRGLVVHDWEEFRHPRVLELVHPREQTESNPDDFVNDFGEGHQCGGGWLTGQSEVHLRFHSNPLKLNAFVDKSISCKVTIELISNKTDKAAAANNNDGNSAANNHYPLWTAPSITHMSTRDEHAGDRDKCTFNLHPTSAIDIEFQTFMPELVTYRLEFSDAFDSSTNQKVIDDVFGYAMIAAIHNPEFEKPDNRNRVRQVPLMSSVNLEQIGEIHVDTLFVNSLDLKEHKLLIPGTRFWREGRRAIYVGHRGLGANIMVPSLKSSSNSADSRSEPANPKPQMDIVQRPVENTIGSFKAAFDAGADMIEFDVQLTKDDIPVVYHDFDIPIISPNEEMVRVPIKDLTYNQLASLKTSENWRGECFPSLMHVLRELDVSVALNVEVKYAMQYRHGGFEMADYFERNHIVDTVLTCLADYQKYEGALLGGSESRFNSTDSQQSAESATSALRRNKPLLRRQIILSSFDPDCCIMLQRKQNSYPVFFLSQGNDMSVWPQYYDFRTWNANTSLAFAISQHLEGIAVPASDVLSKTSKEFLRNSKKSQLVLFCWTINAASADSAKTIERLLKTGVHGIICDEVGSLMLHDMNGEGTSQKEKAMPLFIAEQKEDEKLWKWLNRLRFRQRLKRLEETSDDLDEDANSCG